MTDEVVLYTNPMSRGRIVRWALEEIGAPYRAEYLDYGTTMKAPEYLAINPMGKVPAIAHRGVVVTETAAICAYLADAFPEAKLAPAISDPTRGAYFRWMFYGAGPFDAAITNHSLGVIIPPEKKGFVGYGCYEDVINTLEKAVSANEFILGNQFSMADIYVGAQINFGLKFKMVPALAAFENYVGRLNARPARMKAEAIDNALAAESKAKAS